MSVSLPTKTALNTQLCTYNKPVSLSPRGIVKNGGSFNGIVGVAITGVPIFAGLSESSKDPFYPTSGSSMKTTVDECFGDANPTSKFYHYLVNSPCIKSSALRSTNSIKICSDSTSCNTAQAKDYLLTDATQSKVPIGIALDGHLIYGPYKASSTVWSGCEVDACNGLQVNGNYGYVTTKFHPYTVGCWGPGNTPTASQDSCTTNARTCP